MTRSIHQPNSHWILNEDISRRLKRIERRRVSSEAGPAGPAGPAGADSVVPGPAGPAGPAGSDALADGNSPIGLLKPLSGAFIGNGVSASGFAAIAGIANVVRIIPVMYDKEMVVDQALVSVSTAVAASNVRVVVFDADANGRPTTKLFESGNISGAALGTIAVAASFTFTARKLYWIGVHTSATTGLRALATSSSPVLSLTNAATPVMTRTLQATVTFGTLTDWPTYANSQLSASIPALVLFRLL